MIYYYSNDEKLWNDFRSGSKEAFEYLFRRYTKVLYNYSFKICQDKMLIKDAIQEVFINLLSSQDKIRSTNAIKPYLFKSIRLEIGKRLREEQRFSSFSAEEMDFQLEYSNEEKWMEDEITLIRVRELTKVVSGLPRRQKECIYLRFYEGMSYQDIADIMEIEVNSAYKMLYKAIENLYQKLSIRNGQLFL